MPNAHTYPLPHIPLQSARVHEACGGGAVSFAAMVAGQMGGGVMWFRESWGTDHLNPTGYSEFHDPSQLLMVQARNQLDLLATAEEALRDGAVPLVVMELSKPLGLVEGRRLQLAAQAGPSTGVCLIGEGHGSNATQTRWQCSPLFDPYDSTLHQWKLIKNKKGTLGVWNVRWCAATRRIIVVPPAQQ